MVYSSLKMESFREQRIEQLSELEEFIKVSTDQLNAFLDTVGWSPDGLKNKVASDMVSCHFNPEHRMPQQSLKRHLEKCMLSMEGYKPNDTFLSPPEFSSAPSAKSDHNTLEELQQSMPSSSSEPNQGVGTTPSCSGRPPPRTSWRLLTDLTPAERSALHTAVTSARRETGPSLGSSDLQLPYSEDSKQSRPKSKLELLAEQRDAKRRRMNHKKVHTLRKTHTEVLREVIRNQMEYLVSQDIRKTSDD